jgi:glycosyltransferase involved in cell wall biosynthesis
MTATYAPDYKKIQESGLTFSIVIETENLGMAGLDDVRATLDSLADQDYSIHQAREILVIAGGAVSEETLQLLKQEYPWITIHREIQKLEYLTSKIRGCEIATGDIVVMVDSDAVYHPTWLGQTLYGFISTPGTSVVASETRIKIDSIYTTAIQLAWMINADLVSSHPTPITQFHLNNFAIKRSVALQVPLYNNMPIYRANNVEWKKQLRLLGYSAIRVPGILAHHAPPGNFWDWWWRMLVSGSDAVAKADFIYHYGGQVTEKISYGKRCLRIPMFFVFKIMKMITRLRALVTEDWKQLRYIIPAIPVALFFILVMELGALITLFNRDYVFKKITAREQSHVV